MPRDWLRFVLESRLLARVREFSTSAAGVFERPGRGGFLLRAASFWVPFGVFAVVLNTPYPEAALASSSQNLTPVALFAVALAICHRLRGWVGMITAFSATLGLFALPLAALWQDAAFHVSAIGGLLPFSDASGYYYDARRLLDGHLLGWTARRPLFVGLLSTLLALTGQNLQISIAAMVAINAVACFILARELRESHGAMAAAVVTSVIFVFYRREGGLGTTLTENLGLALGSCAFAALLRGARTLDPRSLFVGVGLLTLALMSRAGAFFVLPLIVLAIGWIFRNDRPWTRLGSAAAAVLVPAMLALVMGHRLADPAGEQVVFSNFSYSLYGLVTGGTGWRQVLQDHPQAKEGAEMYALAYHAFLSRPLGVVEGSLKMWGEYLWPFRGYNAYSFIGSYRHEWPAQTACFVLSGLAIAMSLSRVRTPTHAVILASTLGHLASIPFVPPTDAGLRIYAATLPIQAILLVMGLDALSHLSRAIWRLPAPDVPAAEEHRPSWRAAEVFGGGLALVSLVGPWVFLGLSRPSHLADLRCEPESVPVYVRISEGSVLHIRNDGRRPSGLLSATHIEESLLIKSLAGMEIGSDIARFTAGNTTFNGYDLKSGRYVWLVAPTNSLGKLPAVYAVCGRDSADATSKKYGVFYADSAWEVGASQPR